MSLQFRECKQSLLAPYLKNRCTSENEEFDEDADTLEIEFKYERRVVMEEEKM